MAGQPWGGSEVLWHSLALHALSKGDNVFVSVYNWNKPNEKLQILERNKATVFYRERFDPSAVLIKRIVRFIKNRRPELNKDYQSLIDFKPDIVFISQGETFDLAVHHRALYNLLRNNNINYSFICHSHSQYSDIPTKAIYPGAVEIFNNAKNIFFVSSRHLQLTERRLVSRIRNGSVTWNPLNLNQVEKPLVWANKDVIQMALVGSIVGGKGHDTVLEVLAGDVWKNRAWILNLYGDGDGKEYLDDLSKFYGLTDKIVFHGHVESIIRVWETNHILLIPSASEGLPISLVEAMASGRPTVATDVGGISELVIENKTGFLAEAPSVFSFARAMERAWEQKDSWKSIGDQAFASINSKLDRHPEINIYEILKNGN